MSNLTRKRIIIVLTLLALGLFGYYQVKVMQPFVKEMQRNLIAERINKAQENEEQRNLALDSEKYKSQSNQDDLGLNAKSALLLDASSNRVLYDKNGFTEMPMASTTKIMTCIVALENSCPDDVVTFSKRAASMPDVQLNANPGETFKLHDLLYSLMLESHNDTAVAIAEHVGGSVEGFATMMNAKAKELGLEHTHFVTPNGLDADDHYTTAYDLALIASYAIKNKEFVDIINTPSWVFKTTDGKQEYAVTNKDKFLYLKEGSFGIKTGFTNKAGYCFAGALKSNNRVYISVVLGCGWPPHKNYKWQDTIKLMDYGIKYFDYKCLNQYLKDVPTIPVLNGQENTVMLQADNVNTPVLLKATDKVFVEYCLPDYVKAPVKRGSRVGTLRYYINDVLFREVKVFSKNQVEGYGYDSCLKELWNRLLKFR